ncbi:hypothetical protein [Parabacteroides sp.]
MKRIYTLLIIAFIASPPASGQGFLKKLGKKAQEISKSVLGEDEKKEAVQEEEATFDMPTEDSMYAADTHGDEASSPQAPKLGSTDPNAPRILTFALGEEQGIIDHKNGKIEITVSQTFDFEHVVPVYTTGGSGDITGVPASGKLLKADSDPYFTVRDSKGRTCVYEVVLHIRGMDRKDIRPGIKQGTLRMVNSMQGGYPDVRITYYFDNYGQQFAMLYDIGAGMICDYTNGKVIVLNAVKNIESLRKEVLNAADLRINELKSFEKELEDALKNGPKDMEHVYEIHENLDLAGKLACPFISDFEAMPEQLLARSNGRRLPGTTTIAGKPCVAFEFRDPESGMAMTYYSWKNIHFGGGMKGVVYGRVESFSESVPAGIFGVPKGYRPLAEYQKEVEAINKEGEKTLRKHTDPLMQLPEMQALKEFYIEYSKELNGHGPEEEK